MAVDMLRSFHAVDTWFDDARTIKAKIRWYPCKPGAKPLPIPSAFGSAVWEPHPDEWTVGPGVESGPLSFRRSRYPAPKGDHFHGDPDAYLKGITSEQYAEAVAHPTTIGDCHPFAVQVSTVAVPQCEWSVSAESDAHVAVGCSPEAEYSILPL